MEPRGPMKRPSSSKLAPQGWELLPQGRWTWRMLWLAALATVCILSTLMHRPRPCLLSDRPGLPQHPRVLVGGDEFEPCWATPGLLANSPGMRAKLASMSPEVTSNTSGLVVYGDECKRCAAGKPCSFYILLVGSAYWGRPRIKSGWVERHRSSEDPYRWELMALLKGPALAHATVTPVTADARFLRADFTTWDPGMYRVTLYSSCGILHLGARTPLAKGFVYGWADPDKYPESDVVATWSLRVDPSPSHNLGDSGPGLWHRKQSWREAANAISWALGEPRLPLNLQIQPQAQRGFLGATRGPGPCLESLQARWLLRNGEYRWTPYSCAPATPPARDVPALLVGRGVREINLVGDSHMRFLAMHLFHVLVAGEGRPWQPTINRTALGTYRNFSFIVPAQGPGTAALPRAFDPQDEELRINYYWADFVSQIPKYGCKKPRTEGRHKTFANTTLPRDADITMINVGTWTAHYCQESELAISGDLENAISWAASQAKRRKGGAVIVRSASTRYTNGFNCFATNGFLQVSNSMAKMMTRRYKAHYFDSWQVEAPRFVDVCSNKDHHYSCHDWVPVNRSAMSGEVGEAVVKAFLHHIVHMKR